MINAIPELFIATRNIGFFPKSTLRWGVGIYEVGSNRFEASSNLLDLFTTCVVKILYLIFPRKQRKQRKQLVVILVVVNVVSGSRFFSVVIINEEERVDI